MTTTDGLLVSRKEAARMLGVSEWVVKQWIKAHRLRAIKTSDAKQGRVMLARDDVLALAPRRPSRGGDGGCDA